MRNLLSAGFTRLFKSRIFLIFVICIAVLSIFICNANIDKANNIQTVFDYVFFVFYPFVDFFLAAIVSLFIGQDYSDGTIRNKLIVGHSRAQVYFSNLIISSALAVILMVAHGVITYIFSLVMKYNFTGIDAVDMIRNVLLCTLAAVAVSALFTALSMNCSNRAVCVIIMFALVLMFMFLQGYITSALNESETTVGYVIYSDSGIEWGPEVPNPNYISDPIKRAVFEVINDFPTGQLVSAQNLDFTNSEHWWIVSLVYYAVTSLAGYGLFRKKDLK